MSLILEHLGDVPPCLPHLVVIFVVPVLSVHIAGSIFDPVLDRLVIIFIAFYISMSLLDGHASHLELLLLPAREGGTAVSPPEHLADANDSKILTPRKMLVPRKLFDVLEALVPEGLFDHVSQGFDKCNSLAGVITPCLETRPELRLVEVLITLLHEHAHGCLVPCAVHLGQRILPPKTFFELFLCNFELFFLVI